MSCHSEGRIPGPALTIDANCYRMILFLSSHQHSGTTSNWIAVRELEVGRRSHPQNENNKVKQEPRTFKSSSLTFMLSDIGCHLRGKANYIIVSFQFSYSHYVLQIFYSKQASVFKYIYMFCCAAGRVLSQHRGVKEDLSTVSPTLLLTNP